MHHLAKVKCMLIIIMTPRAPAVLRQICVCIHNHRIYFFSCSLFKKTTAPPGIMYKGGGPFIQGIEKVQWVTKL